MVTSLLLLASLCGFASAQFDSSVLSNVTTAFMTAQIVPNVIPTFAPTALLDVEFTSLNVTPGALLSMADTATEPQFTLETDPNSNSSIILNSFIIAIIDPDAPTPQNPTSADFIQFLGGDFNPDPITGLLSNSSPALVEYAPPTPPAGSDPHRYVVLLYNQPDSFDTSASDLVNSTTNFNLTGFAQQLGIGDPAAGNYFLVGPDGSSGSSGSTPASSLPTPSSTDGSLTGTDGLPTSISTDNGGTSTPAAAGATSTSTTGSSEARMRIDLRTTIGSFLAVFGLLHVFV